MIQFFRRGFYGWCGFSYLYTWWSIFYLRYPQNQRLKNETIAILTLVLFYCWRTARLPSWLSFRLEVREDTFSFVRRASCFTSLLPTGLDSFFTFFFTSFFTSLPLSLRVSDFSSFFTLSGRDWWMTLFRLSDVFTSLLSGAGRLFSFGLSLGLSLRWTRMSPL